MFELTSNYLRWTCLTFPATFVAKIQRLYHIQSCHYDVIIPQDLNLRNQTVRREVNIGLGTRLHNVGESACVFVYFVGYPEYVGICGSLG